MLRRPQKKSVKVWLLFLGLAVCFALPAHGETFDAIVTTIYDGGSTMEATMKDEFGKVEEKARLVVDPDVTFEGLASLQDLEVGQRLHLEAEKTFDGRWIVHKVKHKPPETIL